MNTETIIEKLGGVRETAKLAGCTVQAVYQWQWADKIPKRSLQMLRLAKPKIFKAMEEEAGKTAPAP